MEPAQVSSPVEPGGRPPDFVQSVGRALRVLEVVGRRPGLPVKTIARLCELNISTTYHLVRTLAYEGYVVRRRDGTYVSADAVARHLADPTHRDHVRRTQTSQRAEGTLMQITRSTIDTVKGPGDWFTGDVYIDAVAAAPPPSRVTANLVHFMPGARTHWHRHPLGQTVFVTEGVGLCQRRGGAVEVIRPGDGVLFEADEEHWHGASPNRLMVHLAINEGDGVHDVVHWLSPVTDEEYGATTAAED
jgi:quercetin dioxygenase-like cupin family protein